MFAICVSKLLFLEITDFLRKKFTSGFSKINYYHEFDKWVIFENQKWTSSSRNDWFLEEEVLNRKHCNGPEVEHWNGKARSLNQPQRARISNDPIQWEISVRFKQKAWPWTTESGASLSASSLVSQGAKDITTLVGLANLENKIWSKTVHQ